MIERLTQYFCTNKYRILASTLLILSPFLLLLLITYISGGSIFTAHPIWIDELLYWHEIKSVYEHGLDFGYYTVNGATPSFLTFGMHGFAIIISYLPYAYIMGWSTNSILIANTVYMTLAFILLVMLVKPSAKKTFLIGLFFFCYAPIIFYISSSMTEILNIAIIVTYYSLFYKYIHSKRYKRVLFYILLAFTIYMCFVRVTHIIFLLPLFLCAFNIKKIDKTFFKCLVLWLLLSGTIRGGY